MVKSLTRTTVLALAVASCGAVSGRPADWTEGRVEADGAVLFTKTMGAGDPILVVPS